MQCYLFYLKGKRRGLPLMLDSFGIVELDKCAEALAREEARLKKSQPQLKPQTSSNCTCYMIG